MKKGVLKSLVVILSLVVAASSASAAMRIDLRDGRSMNVDVNAEDILTISFDGKKQVSDGNTTWNFETGDLQGWTATGEAFNNQPTYGDNPTARHRGQPSNHEGNYWIGGYENRHTPNDQPGAVQGDGPQGTLTSQPFTITQPGINFLLGGGCDINTVRVELIVDGQVVRKATGKCTETMERVRFDVSTFMGRSAQIRLVDESSGGWGHINFDDLRFE